MGVSVQRGSGGGSAGSGGVTGSFTSSRLPKAQNQTTLVDSLLYESGNTLGYLGTKVFTTDGQIVATWASANVAPFDTSDAAVLGIASQQNDITGKEGYIRGVMGIAYGETASDGQVQVPIGVLGRMYNYVANNRTGVGYGLYGYADGELHDNSNTGKAYAIFGQAVMNAGQNSGGETTNSGAIENYGVFGAAEGSVLAGTGNTVRNIGVFGTASAGTENWGGWFDGNVKMDNGEFDITVDVAVKSSGPVIVCQSLYSGGAIRGGDSLFSIFAQGYPGATTDSYVTAAKIEARVLGTVSDTTLGVGAGIVISTRKAGQALQERFRIADTGAIGLAGPNYGSPLQTILSNGPNSPAYWGDVSGGGGGSGESLYVTVTPVQGGTTGGKSAIATYTIANHSTVDQDVIVLEAWGQNASAANQQTLRVELGGVIIATFHLVGNNKFRNWKIVSRIVRVSAASQYTHTMLFNFDGILNQTLTSDNGVTVYANSSLNFNTDLALQVTAESNDGGVGPTYFANYFNCLGAIVSKIAAPGTGGSGGGGSGSVTSVNVTMPGEYTVTGAPVTSSGTIAIAKVVQSMNLVYAGPTSGADADPFFRALVAADLPAHSAALITSGTLAVARGGTNSGTTLTNNRLMVSSGGAIVEAGALLNGQVLVGSTGGAPAAANLTAGSGISITNGAASITIAATGAGTGDIKADGTVPFTADMSMGSHKITNVTDPTANQHAATKKYVDDSITASASGSVTSVAISVPPELSAAGSPITTAGTFTISKTSQTANTVAAGPASGGAATWGFRALQAADIPSLAASKITSGTLAVARGGTNSGTALTNKQVMVSSGGAIVEAGAMTNGQILIGNTGNAPTIATLTAGSNVTITNSAGGITIAATGGGGGGSVAGSDTQVQFNDSGSFGANSGFLFDVANQNYVMGSLALNSRTTGYDNVAIGGNALTNATSAQGSVGIGFNAGLNTTDTDVVAIGYLALQNNITGNSNTAIGYTAAVATTGYATTAIGYSAGASNISGDGNTFIGADANCSASSLFNATAIGYSAVVNASNTIQLGNGCSVIIDFGLTVGTTLVIGSLSGVLVASSGTVSSISPVADGTYTMGIGGTQNGTITIVNGVITAVQEAIA